MKKIIAAAALAGAVILVGCAGGMPVTGWFDTTPAPAAPAAPVYTTPPSAYEAPPPVMLAPQQTATGANRNAYVVSLQTRLRAARFYSGRIDGVCGHQTRAAVANYQDANHIPPHMDAACGVGDHTWTALGESQGGKPTH